MRSIQVLKHIKLEEKSRILQANFQPITPTLRLQHFTKQLFLKIAPVWSTEELDKANQCNSMRYNKRSLRPCCHILHSFIYSNQLKKLKCLVTSTNLTWNESTPEICFSFINIEKAFFFPQYLYSYCVQNTQVCHCSYLLGVNRHFSIHSLPVATNSIYFDVLSLLCCRSLLS